MPASPAQRAVIDAKSGMPVARTNASPRCRRSGWTSRQRPIAITPQWPKTVAQVAAFRDQGTVAALQMVETTTFRLKTAPSHRSRPAHAAGRRIALGSRERSQ